MDVFRGETHLKRGVGSIMEKKSAVRFGLQILARSKLKILWQPGDDDDDYDDDDGGEDDEAGGDEDSDIDVWVSEESDEHD